MAQQVMLVDDLTGGEAVETIAFSIDGHSYEIDVNAANAAALRTAIHPFAAVSREVKATTAAGTRPARKTGGTPRGDRAARDDRAARNSEIRTWARDNGYDVPERGRLSKDVIAAYDAAHPGA